MPKEQDLKNLIVEWLNANQILAYKNNSGVFFFKNKGGNMRCFRAGIKGLPDISFYLKGGLGGFVETKSKYKKLSKDQEAFKEKAEKQGIIYILAYSLEDVIKKLKNYF